MRYLLFTIYLVVLCVLAYVAYTKVADKRIVSQDTVDSKAGVQLQDWKLMLNRAAHAEANKEWCINSGYNFDVKTGHCSVGKEACEALSNKRYKHGDKQPFMFWDEKNKMCLRSNNAGTIKKNICENPTFKTTFSANLTFSPGKLKCDKDGFCTLDKKCTNAETLDSGGCPTCIIPKGYCESKGLDYKSLNGLGDCTETDAQVIFEAIAGKTITRKWKENYLNMQKECCHRMLSWNCAKSFGTFVNTQAEVVVKGAQKYMNDLVAGFKKNCSGDFTKTTQDFLNCSWSMLKFNPVFYASEVAVKMTDSLLGKIFGHFGLPNNVIQNAVGYTIKYGYTAMVAIFHFGQSTIDAIDKAGALTISFLDKIGISKGVLDATGLGYALAGIHMIGQFGGEAAKALAQAGVQAVHVLIKFAEAGAKVINCAVGAVMHPIQFCKHLIGSIVSGKAFEDVVVDALKAMKSAGLLLKQTLRLFAKGLSIMGKELEAVYKAVAKALSNLEEGIEDAGKAIAHAFSSIF